MTNHDDFIEEERFRTWWEHLRREGTACLTPDRAGNPHPWRSRIVGAILARCLSNRIRWDRAGSGLLHLIGPRPSDVRPA